MRKKKKIESLNNKEIVLLKTPLANARKWMQPDDLETFLDLIRGIYGLGQPEITMERALKLFTSILQMKEMR